MGAWNEAHTESPFSHVVFFKYHFDGGDPDFLVLLDLLDFIRNKFFFLSLSAPSAASWFRARHANSAVRCVRSRAYPLGCTDLSAKDRQITQDSKNNFLVVAWFAEQAASQRVPSCFFVLRISRPQSAWARIALVAGGVSAPQRVQWCMARSGLHVPFRKYGAKTPNRHADQYPRPTTICLSWLAVVQRSQRHSSVQRTAPKGMPLFGYAQRSHQQYWWVISFNILVYTLFFSLAASLSRHMVYRPQSP